MIYWCAANRKKAQNFYDVIEIQTCVTFRHYLFAALPHQVLTRAGLISLCVHRMFRIWPAEILSSAILPVQTKQY